MFSAKKKNIFLETRSNFHLTVKYFSLTNFSNGKQTRENLECGQQKTTFLKQTGPKSPTGRAKSSPPIMMKRSFTSSKLFKQFHPESMVHLSVLPRH